jgi:hypothetical protein
LNVMNLTAIRANAPTIMPMTKATHHDEADKRFLDFLSLASVSPIDSSVADSRRAKISE